MAWHSVVFPGQLCLIHAELPSSETPRMRAKTIRIIINVQYCSVEVFLFVTAVRIN